MGLRPRKATPHVRQVMDEDEDDAIGQPSSPGSEISAEQSYMISGFRWSDGKTGVSVKVWVTPQEGETLEQAATRANKFMARKMREAEDTLNKEEE